MTFKELFDKTQDGFKTKFLYEILNENTQLKNRFLESIPSTPESRNQKTVDIEEFEAMVDGEYKDYLELLETIDLEPDWENYVPSHSGYIPEWEALTEMGEQVVEDTLSGFTDELQTMLLQGDITGVVAELLAFYAAASDVEIDDSMDCFDSVNFYIIDNQFKEAVEFTVKKMRDLKFDNDELINVLKLFFDYYGRVEKERLTGIRSFEDLLIAILESISDKDKIPPFDRLSVIDPMFCPLFVNALMKYNTSSKSREEVLNELLFTDNEIGKELLEYYLENELHEKYLETAKKLFAGNKKLWAEVVCDNIKPEDDRDFFIEVNFQQYLHTSDIKYYKKIKPLLTRDEKENILKRIRDNYQKIILLEEDKNYEKIKEIIDGIPDHWDFTTEIFVPILNVYPDFCFDKIRYKVNKLMTMEKRNRNIYRDIAGWLTFAKKIPEFENKANDVIISLYNHKPPLPALKDEFRKEGIV